MENGGVNFDRCLLEKPFVHQQSFTFEKKTAPVSPSPPPSFLSQFSFFTPPVQTPIRNHLHARKPADVDLAHHQLLLPWEPKQRNLSPACTHRLSHTFLTCLHSKQSQARAAEKSLSSAALPSRLSAVTRNMHADIFGVLSLSRGSGQINARSRLRLLSRPEVRARHTQTSPVHFSARLFAAQNQGSGCTGFCFKKNGEVTANTKFEGDTGSHRRRGGGGLCAGCTRGMQVGRPSRRAGSFFRNFLILPGKYLSCCVLLERAVTLIYCIRRLSGSEHFAL